MTSDPFCNGHPSMITPLPGAYRIQNSMCAKNFSRISILNSAHNFNKFKVSLRNKSNYVIK